VLDRLVLGDGPEARAAANLRHDLRADRTGRGTARRDTLIATGRAA
jgi:hypothetical protein